MYIIQMYIKSNGYSYKYTVQSTFVVEANLKGSSLIV